MIGIFSTRNALPIITDQLSSSMYSIAQGTSESLGKAVFMQAAETLNVDVLIGLCVSQGGFSC